MDPLDVPDAGKLAGGHVAPDGADELAGADAAVREGALLVEAPEFEALRVSGPDRASWLNGVLTADTRLAPHHAAWSLALNKQGKVLAEVLVAAGEREHFLAVSQGTAAALLAHLERMLVMEDAEIADASAELAWLWLHGPRATTLASGALDHDGDVTVWAPLDRTGLGGALVGVRRAALGAVVARLVAAGAVHAPPVVGQALLVRHGVPRFGVDFDASDNPHEAGLERRAVSWNKGCYLGQEVVCMQDMRGRVKRRVVPLRVAGAAEVGADVLRDGRSVGRVTSAVALGSAGVAALARLEAGATEVGTVLAVGDARAEVVSPGATG